MPAAFGGLEPKTSPFDEDLWLIELDIADPERFVAETTSSGLTRVSLS
jgi:hypothetical protein